MRVGRVDESESAAESHLQLPLGRQPEQELSVPTLVLWSTQDTMFFESPDQETLRASLDAAPVRSFFKAYGKRPLPASGMQEDELGHNLQWGAPREVALDLAAYLRAGGAPTPDLYHASAADVRQVETTPGAARVVALGFPDGRACRADS